MSFGCQARQRDDLDGQEGKRSDQDTKQQSGSRRNRQRFAAAGVICQVSHPAGRIARGVGAGTRSSKWPRSEP